MRFMCRYFALFLLLLFYIKHQQALAQLPDFNFEIINSKNGLSSNTVYLAVRDKKGMMWFGTRLCPIRYDGSSFQSFLDPETTFVTGLAVDQDDNIWFASSNSPVCMIDGNTKKVRTIENTQYGGDFFIDSKNRGWYSDFSGVYRLNLKSGELQHYSMQSNKFAWNKAFFVEDKDNKLWVIGRDNGVFKYNDDKDSLVCVLGKDYDDSLIEIACATFDEKGNLWLGTYNRGLIKYDPGSGEVKNFATNDPENKITGIASGNDENNRSILWVGNGHQFGVFRPDENNFYFYDQHLQQNVEVNGIYKDPDNIVWVCTSQGIIKCTPKNNAIRNVPLPKNIVEMPVDIKVIMQDRSRPAPVFYLGLSHSGILKWEAETNNFERIPLEADVAEVNWIAQRDDGTIWIGTNRWDYKRPGLFVYNPVTKQFITTPFSQLINKSFSVPFFHFGFFDNQNRLWVGNSDEGVRVFDEDSLKEVTPWPLEKQLALIGENNLITSIALNEKDEMLLGMKEGVYKANQLDQSMVCLDTSSAAKQIISVNSLMIDSQQNLWAARWGGLTAYSKQGDIKTILATKDGFYDTEINGLAEDNNGNIWIGNMEGLYCYNVKSKRLTRFTSEDGLTDNNTAGRLFISADKKELYILQQNGFTIINIGKILMSKKVRPIVIGSFKIHGNETGLDITKPVILDRHDNTFSVDFISPDYKRAVDQYSYYLMGLENNWRPYSSNHVAYYTNLAPGKYVLCLKAVNAGGLDFTRELPIQVLPAPYETGWFKFILLLVIIAILYGVYTYRVNQLLKLQQVRNRISADLHDELGSSLSGISILGTLAQKNIPERHPAGSFLTRIVEETQNISGSLDDIVWNISPKNDSLSSIIARMTRYASEMFEARQIRYQFTFPEQIDHLRLSMEHRRNFYLIFKEAVNNLVKYSRCSLASMKVEIQKRKLVLVVQDDGVGFDISKKHDRNGLRNMKERADKLKGKLAITSAPGSGTTIRLEFAIRE